MKTLKPCSHCGSKAGITPTKLVVFCTNNDCGMRTVEAIACVANWNRRTLSPEIAEALREAKEVLKESRRVHNNCEDSWYSCPKSIDGCADDSAGEDCNCGVDRINAKIDAALARIEGVR